MSTCSRRQNLLTNKKTLLIVICTWIFIAAWYLIHTKWGDMDISMCYDCLRHFGKTHWIAVEHRLTGGTEMSHQPPLYYLINSIIFKDTLFPNHQNENPMPHINVVRALSVIYGGLTLFLLSSLLKQITKHELDKLLVLLYLCTTPKFVNIFTSYNNDVLLILLIAALGVIAYKLYYRASFLLEVGLFITAVASIFTKYTSVLFIISLILICCKNFLRFKPPMKNELRIILILTLSLITLIPWIYYCKKIANPPVELSPAWDTNVFKGINNTDYGWLMRNIIQASKMVIRIPLLQLPKRAWEDPWVHTLDEPQTKKSDFWAYSWISSAIGAVIYHKPSQQVIWLLLFVHLLIYIIAFREIFRSKITQLATFIIFFTGFMHLGYLVEKNFEGSAFDYRYQGWNLGLWTILILSALSNPTFRFIPKRMLMIIAVLINTYVVMVGDGYLW